MQSDAQRATTTTVVLIGNASVGKTAIASALGNAPFNPDSTSTVGASSVTISYVENSETKYFLIWDTAGQEQYRSLGPMYYRNASAAICVYDVTIRKSFEQVEGWIQAYHAVVGDKSPILLIGNKIDRPDRIIDTDEGKAYAAEHGYAFLEVSAKKGSNIDLIVTELQRIAKPAGSGGNGLDQGGAQSRCC
jgi:small GTP-binding protein